MTAGEWESALDHLTRSLTIFETVHGGPCHATVDILSDLVNAHTKLGNTDEAAQAAQRANDLVAQGF